MQYVGSGGGEEGQWPAARPMLTLETAIASCSTALPWADGEGADAGVGEGVSVEDDEGGVEPWLW